MDGKILEALKLISSIEPKDIDLVHHGNYFATISNNYLIASTAEYVEDTKHVSRDNALKIAVEVRGEMDNCDEYNSYESEFIEAVMERGDY